MNSTQPGDQEHGGVAPRTGERASAVPGPPAAPVPATPGETPPAAQLTPEEQMALYEKELKETDWGHQPC